MLYNFVDSLYDYEYSGINEEERIVIETDQIKPVSHTVADQSKLDSCTDSSSEEEDLQVHVNFDKTIDLAIN